MSVAHTEHLVAVEEWLDLGSVRQKGSLAE